MKHRTPAPPTTPTTRPASHHLLLLLSYSLLAIILTAPLIFRFRSHIAGLPGDSYQFLWNYWWMKTALLNLHTNPFHTSYMFHPIGISLVFHTFTPLKSLISIPLQILFGLIPTYNLLLLGSLAIGAWGANLLAYQISASRYGALLSGIIFAFCPYHMAVSSGHMNLASFTWIPFSFLFLERNMTSANYRFAVTAGFFAALTTWNSLNLGTATAIAWACWFLFRMTFRSNPTRSLPMAQMLAACLSWGILISPLLVLCLRELHSGQLLYLPQEAFTTDLLAFLLPSYLHPCWGFTCGLIAIQKLRPNNYALVYPGFLTLVLALWGTLNGNRALRCWTGIAVIFSALSLGSTLHIAGHPIHHLCNIPLNLFLPYTYLEKLPLLRAFRIPGRMHCLTILALAILSAGGLTRLSRYYRRLPHIILLLLLFDYLPIPFPTTAITPPETLDHLRKDPQLGAVLQFPLLQQDDRHILFQIHHHRPVQGGRHSRTPANAWRRLLHEPALARLAEYDDPSLNTILTDSIQFYISSYYPQNKFLKTYQMPNGFNFDIFLQPIDIPSAFQGQGTILSLNGRVALSVQPMAIRPRAGTQITLQNKQGAIYSAIWPDLPWDGETLPRKPVVDPDLAPVLRTLGIRYLILPEGYSGSRLEQHLLQNVRLSLLQEEDHIRFYKILD